MKYTQHAVIRAQQRCIPPLIDLWLGAYREVVFDGHRGVVRYFSRRSIRAIEWDFGREPVRWIWEYLDAYKVVSGHNGLTITVGHLTKLLRRR
jgi:hypothetical protein